MSYVKVGDREICVEVHHQIGEWVIERKYKKITCNGVTKVFIKENDALLGYGRSYCSSTDQFARKIGLKLAMTRALQNTGLNRQERTAVWAHFGRNGKKKTEKPETISQETV